MKIGRFDFSLKISVPISSKEKQIQETKGRNKKTTRREQCVVEVKGKEHFTEEEEVLFVAAQDTNNRKTLKCPLDLRTRMLLRTLAKAWPLECWAENPDGKE